MKRIPKLWILFGISVIAVAVVRGSEGAGFYAIGALVAIMIHYTEKH